MNKRLELLTTCHHSTPTSSSSLIGSRNDQNNSECSLEEIQSNFEKENDGKYFYHYHHKNNKNLNSNCILY